MDISIFGLGCVGAVSLACLARDDHQVIGADIQPANLALIRDGRTPVVEEGVLELMREVVASGRVQVTDNRRDAVLRSEISLICVGTPSPTNGSQDQSAMQKLAHDVGEVIRDKKAGHVFVCW